MGEFSDKSSVEVCKPYKRLVVFKAGWGGLVEDILDFLLAYSDSIPRDNIS